MACIDDEEASDFIQIAASLNMDVLIEVHTLTELARALKFSPSMLGINNRNLKTLEVDLKMTEKLAPMVDKSTIVVSESGIYNHHDILRMQNVGINTFLVGESLMREKDVEAATKRLLGTAK
jgi:indole-3-glycerol phosphate synthase